MKVAIIGAGSLGQSIAKGLLKNKVVSSLYLQKEIQILSKNLIDTRK